MRLFRLPPRNCEIQSLKRPKVCALLGYQFLLNTMIFFFFFFFKQTQPVSCLGSKAKLTKVHQECQQILLTINHPHTSLTTNRELIMLIVGYLAAAPSINKCTKYSYSGCNTHTHTHTHGHLKLTMLWFLLRLLVTDKEQLFVLERLKSSINLSIFITSNTPKNNLPWLVGFFGKN